MAPKSLFGVPWCNNALAHLVIIFIWYVQINKAKDTIAVLLSKSKNDDLLINALSAELAGARQVPDLKMFAYFLVWDCLQYVEDLTYDHDNNTPLAFFPLFSKYLAIIGWAGSGATISKARWAYSNGGCCATPQACSSISWPQESMSRTSKYSLYCDAYLVFHRE